MGVGPLSGFEGGDHRGGKCVGLGIATEIRGRATVGDRGCCSLDSGDTGRAREFRDPRMGALLNETIKYGKPQLKRAV